MSSAPTLQRHTFTASRALEFFSEKELTMQIGHSWPFWSLALVKELIDNALDACETSGIAPRIVVQVAPDAVTVHDNGPGLPVATLARSLDYLTRTSDKSHYVSPTRGQLGNALKCVWAAPFVASGQQHGRVEVRTGGELHTITVGLDRIAQRPDVQHEVSPCVVKTGTSLTMHWPEIASYLLGSASNVFYNAANLPALLRGYAACNPHATFVLEQPGFDVLTWSASEPDWKKWSPSAPTSPHWYTVGHLRHLIAGLIAAERAGGPALTVRELVAQFAGLSGSAKQKAVTDAAGLTGQSLADLVEGSDVPVGVIDRLLQALREQSRPIKPAALGILGDAHLRTTLEGQCTPGSVQYKKVVGDVEGLPFVVEAAFGVFDERWSAARRTTSVGLNWTPTITSPLHQLDAQLGEQRVDRDDPVQLVVHLACPRFAFTDRGKAILALPQAISEALAQAVEHVTRAWKREKNRAAREGKLRARQLQALRKEEQPQTLSIKAASYQVMEEAYLKASAGNTLPANARQVMYAARPLVLALTGGQCWKDSSYFTQHLLPDFIDAHPDLTAAWDVVYDARGHLTEPHTSHRADLGTLAVRKYIEQWGVQPDEAITLGGAYPTRGPGSRYRAVLFLEKEGFNSLLEAARIAERFDIAIMSTKGMSVTAARTLVEQLSAQGVTILVAHDFDKSGFSIVHTLQSDTRRYQFSSRPRVVDLGLRLGDIEAMALESEQVDYTGSTDPRDNLRESGATEAECSYLVRKQIDNRWSGERVELNAMTSDQFIAWLEQKLVAHQVQKVVPDDVTLAAAYRRAWRRAQAQRAIDRVLATLPPDEGIPIPPALADQVAAAIQGSESAWDDALVQIAQQQAGDL
jgi:DNA topoisomerase VI subunit B